MTVCCGSVVQSPGKPMRSHVYSATWTLATMARTVMPDEHRHRQGPHGDEGAGGVA